MEKDNKAVATATNKFDEGIARAAYRDLKVLVAEEILQLTKSQFCKPLKLIVKTSEKEKVVIGDKVGVLATFQLKGKKWIATEDSKMTYEEFETYTDPALVAEMMSSPATEAAYGEDALNPDGLVPIIEAVEIYSRGMDIHDLVKNYLRGKKTRITSDIQGVSRLIGIVDSVGQARMLTALIDALDNRQNEPKVYVEPTYKDLLINNPFGTDKIVHALCVSYWTIADEEWRLLEANKPKPKKRTLLRDLIMEKGPRYTEAVRKIAGKAVITGTIYPVITLKVAKIRLDLVHRPMFYSD